MADNPLVKKLKLKPGARSAVVNAPPGYIESFNPLPEGATLSNTLDGKFDWIQAFIRDKKQIDALAPDLIQALKPEGLLWICFPKGASKIQTDLTRDKGWDAFQESDLKWVTLVSIDATWSAFCLRPHKPGEQRQTWWREWSS